MLKSALRLLSGSLAAVSLFGYAQAPGSDILMAEIAVQDGVLSVVSTSRVTDRAGYDNQPHFLADGVTLYYTSGMSAAGAEQTEVMQYSLTSGETVNLTASTTSEYSPTPMPNNEGFSTILVDDAGKQWLWAFDNSGVSKGKLLDVEPVGYHAWIDDTSVIMFVLGEPHTLQVANIKAGEAQVVASDIGPSLFRIPQSELMSFTQNRGESWWLMSYDHNNGNIESLIAMPEGVTYYAWLTDGSALVARGSALYQWRLGDAPEWKAVADLSSACANGITRMAANQQMSHLALVCTR